MSTTTTIDDTDFFSGHHPRVERSAATVLPMVFELVEPRSLLDVGCGVGAWLQTAQGLGMGDFMGVDGAYVTTSQLLIPRERFVATDLSRPFDAGRRFDLVLSLEVAEHLPAASAGDFVRTLVRHADVVLFSAAAVGQGGTAHLNEQWPRYWAEQFAAENFAAIDCIRRRIWDDESVAWWYRQNMVLYARESAIASNPRLAEAHRAHGGMPLALVHPESMLEKARHSEALRRRSLAARLLGQLRGE
jgi:SAM-dependent methyltransferase